MSEDAGEIRPNRVEVTVCSRALSVNVTDVREGETWSFSAEGLWTDWFVRCGPNGYRNFLADILSVRPVADEFPYFCLVGQVGSGERFRIGRGSTHTFKMSGRLTVYANDAKGFYWNNRGSVRLTAALGGLPPARKQRGPLATRWHALRDLYRRTLGILPAAVMALGACAALAVLPQGRDLLQTTAEDAALGATFRLSAFTASLIFLALQIWFW